MKSLYTVSITNCFLWTLSNNKVYLILTERLLTDCVVQQKPKGTSSDIRWIIHYVSSMYSTCIMCTSRKLFNKTVEGFVLKWISSIDPTLKGSGPNFSRRLCAGWMVRLLLLLLAPGEKGVTKVWDAYTLKWRVHSVSGERKHLIILVWTRVSV